MSGQLSGSSGDQARADRTLVTELRVVVYDRGPEPRWHRDRSLFGPWPRFESELEDYAAVRESGMSSWEAVYRLVANHRPLLERRWSGDLGA